MLCVLAVLTLPVAYLKMGLVNQIQFYLITIGILELWYSETFNFNFSTENRLYQSVKTFRIIALASLLVSFAGSLLVNFYNY
ncbi:hypothetical protein FD41_GL001466 [Lentilactobacillus farraginis DSM 18382 = JCM 14108]|uniref:Uncharacterized protein n=1 Tax=Lentilactobacillus farraginis DSM 18382 = JCM 14108 TaxID=1423743 RepID=A0A0R1V8F7_9LACO|nr:hypothetical protein FD41_GL001466 [Lentilactobacillus farraginis DSM 18382 = JCM 14108]